MKKLMRKSVSVLLVIGMFVSAIPIHVLAETNGQNQGDTDSSLVVDYNMEISDGKLVNQSGDSSLDAELIGITEDDFTIDGTNRVLEFTGDKEKYVRLPKGMITDEPFTIETKFFTNTSADHWLFCLGTKLNSWPDVHNYIFLNPLQGSKTIRAGIKDENNEQLFNQDYSINQSKYNTIHMVFDGDEMSLYVNKELKQTLTHSVDIGQMIEDGTTDDYIGYLGRSLFHPDPAFTGRLQSFKVYNRALLEEEINDTSDEAVLKEAMEELNLPYKEVYGNITLPMQTENGVPVVWETDHEEIIDLQVHQNAGYDDTPAGVVTRPDEDTVVTMTAYLEVGQFSEQKTFSFTVKKAVEPVMDDDYTGYFFTYFAGEKYGDGEQVYFAASQDGLNWKDLNNNKPVLTSSLGEKGVRDPYIIRSPEGDKFYLIATDLNINHNSDWWRAQTAGSQSLMVWESTDLVNWSEQRMVKVALDEAGCTWAPEAFYDEKTGEYIVFWASRVSTDGYNKQRVYYSKTRDFYSFTEPEIYIEKSNDVIDTTIIKHEDTYYRYSKDESRACIMADSVPSLLSSDVTPINAPVLESQGGVEGPAIFKFNGEEKWCLLVDNYGGIGYYPLLTTDLASGDFEVPDSGFSMPSRARHGTPIPVTQKEYDALVEKWGWVTDLEETQKSGPILEYNFEDGQMTDSVGNNDGTLFGNAKVEVDDEKKSKVLVLDGSADTYAAFPTGFFDGRSTISISMDIKPQMDNQNFFTFAIGKNDSRHMFLRTRPNEIRNVITRNSYHAEQGVAANLEESIKDTWINVKILLSPTNMKLYVDNQLAEETDEITTSITDFDGEVLAYLGKSFYNGDVLFKGAFDNIKVYNRILTDREIRYPTLSGGGSTSTEEEPDIEEPEIPSEDLEIQKITQTAQTTKSIQISWNKVKDAAGYVIYRYDADKKEDIQILHVDEKTTSYNIRKINGTSGADLSPGTAYTFKLAAYKMVDGKRVLGKTKAIKTATQTLNPKITKVSKASKSSARITWNKVNGASGYEVYVSYQKTKGFKRAKIANDANILNYTSGTLVRNKNYYYKVRAYKTVNGKRLYSGYSTVQHVVIK